MKVRLVDLIDTLGHTHPEENVEITVYDKDYDGRINGEEFKTYPLDVKFLARYGEVRVLDLVIDGGTLDIMLSWDDMNLVDLDYA